MICFRAVRDWAACPPSPNLTDPFTHSLRLCFPALSKNTATAFFPFFIHVKATDGPICEIKQRLERLFLQPFSKSQAALGMGNILHNKRREKTLGQLTCIYKPVLMKGFEAFVTHVYCVFIFANLRFVHYDRNTASFLKYLVI